MLGLAPAGLPGLGCSTLQSGLVRKLIVFLADYHTATSTKARGMFNSSSRVPLKDIARGLLRQPGILFLVSLFPPMLSCFRLRFWLSTIVLCSSMSLRIGSRPMIILVSPRPVCLLLVSFIVLSELVHGLLECTAEP